MCGIIGYIGNKHAIPILIEGLKSLEYRGYDSAGVVVLSKNNVFYDKTVGHVANLEKKIQKKFKIDGTVGIAHTRWATHGAPTVKNAHPHTDCTKRLYIVHNGIIENYLELKKHLIKRKHIFITDTDTEVVVHLLEDFLEKGNTIKMALSNTLKMIKGAYGLAIVDKQNPNTLFAVRLSSPLVIGVGKNENYVASDPSALIGKTKKIIYLKDGEIAEITKNTVNITTLRNKPSKPEMVELEWNLDSAQKGKYKHFMLKEIFEGPDVIRSSIRGRLDFKKHTVKLGGLEQVIDTLKSAKRFIIVACGTSYFAGLIGEFLFEEIAGIPTEVQFASEFRYRTQPLETDTIILAISQSGETADTLAALRLAKKQGVLTLGIVNVVGSSISRETDAGVYNHIGPEIGVASTKAFLSQLTVLILMAVFLIKKRGQKTNTLLSELEGIPEKMETILAQANKIKKIAEKYKKYKNFLYLGRKYNYPTVLEGALKLKEISYIHAEGCPASEMKHGPIAMIDKNFPSVMVMPTNSVYDKIYSNLEEIKARRGPIIAIASDDNKKIKSVVEDVLFMPKTIEALEPLLAIIPLQLFAYYIGVSKGLNVDKPRNLAKSVTVE